MAVKNVKTLDRAKATNAYIMRAMWNDASPQYQQRIPKETQGDISETIAALDSWQPAWNEVADALINRIGDVIFRENVWKNPLAVFKRGMLRYGDSIEEIARGLLQAKRYDPNKCYEDVFKCSDVEVWANYHRINRQDRYDLTVRRDMLRRAMVDEYGLVNLVDQIMEAPYTSDEFDEYLIMRNLFAEYYRSFDAYKVQVPDVATATTRAERQDVAATITEMVRATAGRMKFLSGAYNAQGVPTSTKASELVLVVTPEFNAMLDVNVIAYAFNVSATDLPYRVVEVDEIGIDGVQAILCDEAFFVCADNLISFDSIYNPKGLAWNYFLHHWGVYSVSRFVNCVFFTTEAGSSSVTVDIELSEVTVSIANEDGVTPTFAPLGGKLRLNAEVSGTVTPEGAAEVPQGVVWSIVGTSGVPKSSHTYMDAEGVLHVGTDEKNTSVTVQAATTYINPNKPIADQASITGTLEISIGKALEATEVSEQSNPPAAPQSNPPAAPQSNGKNESK